MDDYKKIMDRLQEHLEEALKLRPHDWFVICLQGSQNYGVADEESDIDSKLLIIPTIEELVFNKQPVSVTHVMDNDEHVDIKDIREYFKIIRKQNINFVEILFTDYWIVNEKYEDIWLDLRRHAEEIARLNPYAAISCMGGMALDKYNKLVHSTPSRAEVVAKYGFDPKQLSHLIRIAYFLKFYIAGYDYKDCIYLPKEHLRQNLLMWKRNTMNFNQYEAQEKANEIMKTINEQVRTFKQYNINKPYAKAEEILNLILYNVITRYLKQEL